jgi:hypothetical protein
MTGPSPRSYHIICNLLVSYSGRFKSAMVMISILLLVLFFAISCDETFNPWEENDKYHFTIHGYLDASADTQWVRIMPIRDDLLLKPGPINITVSLEHVETGENVVMNDSLFSFAHGTMAWNFWTTMNLQPEQTYRLTATDSDGLASKAQVTLPADYPTPLVLIEYAQGSSSEPSTATVFLEGVERLADVRTVYGRTWFPHLKDTVRMASDHFRVVIDLSEDLQVLSTLSPGEPLESLIDSSARIFIASAGTDYHYFGSISEKVISLPDGVSNIEKGIGYLAGIVSKTIPIESCKAENNQNIIPCDPEPPPW